MSTRHLRIDAHMHWWTIHRNDYSWLTPELTELYRNFGAAEAEPLLAAGRIDEVILLQAAPTGAETSRAALTSAGLPKPIMALTTAGCARENCSAAVGNGTLCAEQSSSNCWMRLTTSAGAGA
jgi:hypothetical protein